MHRIDTDGSVAGAFSDGNPATGTKGTKLDDDWANAVQEELCAVVETCGGTLSKGTNNQVVGQMVSAPTANKVVRRDASGRAQFADPSAAADAATKGYVDAVDASPTLGTGWTGTPAASAVRVTKQGALVSLRVAVVADGTADDADVLTLPVGYRPAQMLLVPCYWYDASGSAGYAGFMKIDTTGLVDFRYWDNGTALVVNPVVANGDQLYFNATFPL